MKYAAHNCQQSDDANPTSHSPGPPARVVRFLGADRGDGRPPATRETRVLVVIEDGFSEAQVLETLRREHSNVCVTNATDTSVRQTTTRRFDVILLCSGRSDGQCRELLEQITRKDPTVPVIVVTAPPSVTKEHDRERHRPPRSDGRHVDAALLLRTVRESLQGPKIKRLIRVTEKSGKTSFLARNARWLSDDLQARYSTPFDWTPPSVSIPVRFPGTGDQPSPQP